MTGFSIINPEAWRLSGGGTILEPSRDSVAFGVRIIYLGSGGHSVAYEDRTGTLFLHGAGHDEMICMEEVKTQGDLVDRINELHDWAAEINP